VAEREKQTDPHRAAAFPNQFAGHVVDRRDVIRVESVSQAKTIGARGGAEENRIIVEGDNCPQPCGGVEDEQERVDRDDSAPDVLPLSLKRLGKVAVIRVAPPLFGRDYPSLVGAPTVWTAPYREFSGVTFSR
jgi:hypothetical protein